VREQQRLGGAGGLCQVRAEVRQRALAISCRALDQAKDPGRLGPHRRRAAPAPERLIMPLTVPQAFLRRRR
jgi:hypothetical protein